MIACILKSGPKSGPLSISETFPNPPHYEEKVENEHTAGLQVV
jgi:hypothetical protein